MSPQAHCTFCLKEPKGNECFKEVTDPDVIRFLCQEYRIDFDRTFRFKNSKESFILPLCPVCMKLFDSIARIQVLLGDVLNEVRRTVIMCPNMDLTGTVSETNLSKHCQTLRTEITRSVNFTTVPTRSNRIRNPKSVVPVMKKTTEVEVTIPETEQETLNDGESIGAKTEEPDKNFDDMGLDALTAYTEIMMTEANEMEDEVDQKFLNKRIMLKNISSVTGVIDGPSSSTSLSTEVGTTISSSNIKKKSVEKTYTFDFSTGLLKPADRKSRLELPADEVQKKFQNIIFPMKKKFSVNAVDGSLTESKLVESGNRDSKNIRSQVKQMDKSESPYFFKCELCDDKKGLFTHLLSFKSHLKKCHKSAKLAYCCIKSKCHKKFPVAILLNRHLQFHLEETTKKYGCEDCDKRFLTLRSWNTHLKWHERSAGCRENRCRCRFCKLSSIYPKNIREHEIADHQDQLIHACNSCDQKYSAAFILEIHAQTHVNEGPYECWVCGVSSEKGSDLENHLVHRHIPRDPVQPKPKTDPIHSTTKKPVRVDIECNICGKICGTQMDYKNHLRGSHGKAKIIYECEKCPGIKSVSFTSYLQHTVNKHENDANQKEFTCPECPKQFTTNFMFQRHIKNHQMSVSGYISCEICETRFKESNHVALESHKKRVHGDANERKEISKVFHCSGENCNKSFSMHVHLLQHQGTNHPELFVYSCDICDKAYSVEAFLQTHIKTHVKNTDVEESVTLLSPLDCTVCGSKYSTANALADHLLKHTGEKKVHCKKCPMKFYGSTGLRLHMARVHGAKRPFKCGVCGKRFLTITNLNSHKEIHDDPENLPTQEPKICLHCGLEFATARLRRNHIQSKHRRQIARICDICGKAVKDFKGHMKMHTGEKKYFCYFCKKGFIQSVAYRYHLSTHTKEKPYICSICRKDFSQQQCLKRHFNRYHNLPSGTIVDKAGSSSQFISVENLDSVQLQGYTTIITIENANIALNTLSSLDFDVLME